MIMCTHHPETNCILGCSKRMAESRLREMILLLYSALMTPYLGTCLQLWGSQQKCMDQTESRGESEDDQRAGPPQPERVGVVQYGEQKALGTPYSSLPAPKGDKKKNIKELGKDF